MAVSSKPMEYNYINPGYGLSLVDTLWNASSYRQPLEQEGDPMTWMEQFWLQISLIVAKEVINVPPVPSISRCINIVYRHKNVWEYQWSNFIYNCMSTFLHYVHCKDALLDCSAPGGERCDSLTWVDEITYLFFSQTTQHMNGYKKCWIGPNIEKKSL